MPYIKHEQREEYDTSIDAVIGELRGHSFPPGDMNYVITCILHAAWNANPRYCTGNELIGVLECAKQEFYRRKLAPYEDKKMKVNGDV